MYLACKWPYILREQHSAANFVFTFERIEKDRIYITEFMNGIYEWNITAKIRKDKQTVSVALINIRKA